MQNFPFVSIICPVYNEERFIVKCVESVLRQNYPQDRLEVFFVDGMSRDKTREKLQAYIEKYSFIRLLDNPQRVVPFALNIGIRESKGDVIIRLDGHCVYPDNYISVLVKYLYELEADNVGAILNTLPADQSTKCVAIALGISHPFGVGNSSFRIGVSETASVDTVPFGCYRKEVFEKIGLFDEELIRNQDDEFNGRLIKSGGKIYLIPELVIAYTARDKLSMMSKMYYQYGLFKPLVNKKLGSPATVRQFFPVLFVLGLVVGAMLSCLVPYLMYVYSAILLLYFLIALAIGFKTATKERNWKLLFALPYVFFVIHCSYGIGYLHGILKILTGKKFIVKSNR